MKVELLSITPNAEDLIENAGRTCYQSEAKDISLLMGEGFLNFL